MRTRWKIGAWILAAITCLAMALGSVVEARAQGAPGSGIAPWKMANTWVHYWDDEVRVTINGTTRTVATDDPKRLDWIFAANGVVSPDGRWLAYVTADDRAYVNAAITVVNLANGQNKILARLPTGFWSALRWSPDSHQLAYVVAQPGLGQPQVYIVDGTGAHQRLALSGGAFLRIALAVRESRQRGSARLGGGRASCRHPGHGRWTSLL